MKKSFFFLVLFSSFTIISQEKAGQPFFTGSVNLTLGINEYYVPFNDDDEYLIDFSGVFFRAGFGYEFMKRVAVSFNAGFDYHWNYAVSAFLTYGAIRFNITENEGDTFFVETSYGKMWRLSSNYPNGNYYGFGTGFQIAGEKRWNTIIRIDFHRKGIVGFKNNRIDSLSFGVGFSFF